MFCTKLIRQFKLPRIRQLSSVNGNKPASSSPMPKPNAQEPANHSTIGSSMHNVSNLDKRILVWVKRYPSMDQVPNQVSTDCLQRAYSKARVRVCHIMMIFTIVAFIVTAISGKREATAGKHIIPEKMKWYAEIKEKGKAEETATAAAAAASGKS